MKIDKLKIKLKAKPSAKPVKMRNLAMRTKTFNNGNNYASKYSQD